MGPVHAISNMSAVADPLFARLFDGVSRHTPIPIRALVRDLVPPMLALGTNIVEVGWVCGWEHVQQNEAGGWPYEAFASLVMAPARYERQPVYFGDVVVAADSDFATLDEALEGRFVMNEPESLSGYLMLVRHLRGGDATAQLGEVAISGSHLASLRNVADDARAFASIDSTVLDMLRARHHPLAQEVRVIHSLGPYPAPPFVVRRDLPLETRGELLTAIKSYAASPEGRKLLYTWNVADIVQVDESEYDGLRSGVALSH